MVGETRSRAGRKLSGGIKRRVEGQKNWKDEAAIEETVDNYN